jgi:hypothetical protein
MSGRRSPRPGNAVTSRRGQGERGQLLVLYVLALAFVIIPMVGLVIDGGNVWSQQRAVQNGNDSAAEAGAVVLSQRLAGEPEPSGGWDAQVLAKITSNAAANGIDVAAAYYTDICGIPLTSTGQAALSGSIENLSQAARVGTGLPSSGGANPDCPSLVVGPPAGVLVIGHRSVPTYFIRIPPVSIDSWSVDTRATAVTGYLQGYCDSTEFETCAILPIAIPVNAATCLGTKLTTTGTPWVIGPVYTVPLCQNGAGNVGWLDWNGTSGGSNDLVCSILHPNNPSINLPTWLKVPEAGNVNGGGGPCQMSVEDALRTYDGTVVMLMEFDAVCGNQPTANADGTYPLAPPYGCGSSSGGGSTQWYRTPSFAFFQLCAPGLDSECGSRHGAYIQGDNSSVCVTADGNGAPGCLIGRFVKILASGTVGAGIGGGIGGDKAIGIQLIK